MINLDITLLKEIFDIISGITIIFSIPAALYQYWKTSKKEADDREYGTYDKLEERYKEFCLLTLEYPELNVSNVDMGISKSSEAKPIKKLTEGQQNQDKIILGMLIPMLERAYLMYKGQTQTKRALNNRWIGWESYIKSWCLQPLFQEYWKDNGYNWDTKFMKYMTAVFKASIEDGTIDGVDLGDILER